MPGSFGSMVESVSQGLFVARDDEAIDNIFAPDFVAHGTERDTIVPVR